MARPHEEEEPGKHATCFLDLPAEALDCVAKHLQPWDRFGLSLCCKALWAHANAAGGAAFWPVLTISTHTAAISSGFGRWLLARQRNVRELTLWEPFETEPGAASPARANLEALRRLTSAAALERLVWNISLNASLALGGLTLPRLRHLELDWLDTMDVVATCTLAADFGAGLPALTHLSLSNLAALRLAPGCLPPALARLSFENVYSAGLLPAVAAAASRAPRLAALQIRNAERRGITLRLEGLEALAPSLTSLLLQHPHQPDPLPQLAALTGLRELSISHANIGTTSAGLQLVAQRLTTLTALSLPCCALHVLPDAVWALPQLQALDIGENYLRFGLPGAAAEAGGLTRLTLDLQYAAEGGMQLGRLHALRALTLVWRPFDLPARLCSALPWLRALTTLRSLQLVQTIFWQPGGPSTTPRDCPAVLSGLEELAAGIGGLSVSLSRY